MPARHRAPFLRDLILGLTVVTATCSWSQPFQGRSNSQLESLIPVSFLEDYEAGKCASNILRFLQRLRAAHISIGEFRFVRVENSGNSSFGYVNVEWSRNSGQRLFQSDSYGHRFAPGERNFGHHSFLVFQGNVIDFDFGNEPTVVGLGNYITQMFLDQTRTKQEFLVPAERKLREYTVYEFSAGDVLNQDIPDRASWTGIPLGLWMQRRIN
jgi:hypothetical protein